MSLPRLKGAISGPIRARGLTVTAAHFSADRGGEQGGGRKGEREKERKKGEHWVSEMGGAPVVVLDVDSMAVD